MWISAECRRGESHYTCLTSNSQEKGFSSSQGGLTSSQAVA